MEHNLPFILKEVINAVCECTNRSKGLTVKGIVERVKSSLKYPDKLNELIRQRNVVKALNEGIKCGIIDKKRGKFVLGPKSHRYNLRKGGDQLKRKHCSRCKRSKKGRRRQGRRRRSKAKRRRRTDDPTVGSTTTTASSGSPTAVSSEESIKNDKKRKERKRTQNKNRKEKRRDSSEDSERSSYQSGNSSSSSVSSRGSDNKRRKKDNDVIEECGSSSEQSPRDNCSDFHSKEVIYIKRPK